MMRMSFPRLLCSFATAALLAGCASYTDTATQELTVTTPGASESICYVELGRIVYKIYPPETINISRRNDSMTLNCLASGNRSQTAVIEPRLGRSLIWNLANGMVIGTAYDLASGAAYRFPNRIDVSFEDTVASPEPLPGYMQPDTIRPEPYEMEQILPGEPVLASDKDAPPPGGIGKSPRLIELEARQKQMQKALDSAAQETALPSAPETGQEADGASVTGDLK